MATRKRGINLAMIPSVSGGLGHVTRTLKLARGLEQADPSLNISYILDEHRLRPFNVDAVRKTGYPVQILPSPIRHERDAIVREILGEVDVVVEDTSRRLIAYRRILPRIKAWISIPMLPLWDEVFMDWPRLEHADHILYAYPGVMPLPEELEPFRDKITVTGPILDPVAPDRAAGRRRLGLAEDERYILYSPRGFPFGRTFGRRVINGVVGAYIRLRLERPELRLVLSAVDDLARIQHPTLPPLDQIEGVILQGVVTPEVAWDCLAGADLAIVEGTSTLFDAAVARTPVLMVPGKIYETALEGTWVEAHDAGVVIWVEDVTRATMLRGMRRALEPNAAADRSARLHELVGTDGREVAVETVLRIIQDKVGR
ncbi:MAG: hypothetical protein H0V51_21910 [Chloroflexi bacterium]|nr:hypothetical protein [Chloroflexota bacterium]